MAEHINLNNPEITTSKDVALRWGMTPDYVRQVLWINPNRFPEGTVHVFACQILVTREGMEAVTGHKEISSSD